MTRVRVRTTDKSVGPGSYWTSSGAVQNNDFKFVDTQRTEDMVHNWPPKGGYGGDVGGVFRSTKGTVTHSPHMANAHRTSLGVTYNYVGPLYVDVNGAPVSHYGAQHSSDNQLLAVGTTAIARSIPTAPAANVSVMLAELFREGVPKAIGATALKNRFSDYRDIGNEYLNYQFGWAPIVSDLKSVAKAISDSDKILRQLERDSGRNVRRKFAFPSESSGAVIPQTSGPYYAVPVLNGNIHQGTFKKTITTSYSKRQWFSGCFTFHFGLSDKQRGGLADQAKKARVLLGLELTPETVWNLTPWSWMADWAFNAGDIFTNMSRFANDDLAMRYGYIMEQVESSQTVLLSDFPVSNAAGIRFPQSASAYRSYSSKLRLPATPYGFGLNTAGFTTRQWAILGALGISRGPNAR